MPRTYKCKSCGIVHEPPTGKHCQNRDDIAGARNAERATEGDFSSVMMDFKKQMDEMATEIRNLRSEQRQEAPQPSAESISEEQLSDSEGSLEEPASPETLRKDRRLMREATRKLRRLEELQMDDEDLIVVGSKKAAGKKSGSQMTAIDKVVKTVDWPHMHVRRMVAGKRKGVNYADVRVEEFVFGFLAMLKVQENKMDLLCMLQILQDLMQDTMEFSWANALTFYEQVGLEVEWGTLKWTDEERIKHLRFTYARTSFPSKKDNREQAKTALVPAGPNTKCCIPYQTHACAQDKDHHPFVHACAYCLRVKSAICRHPESECYRKTTDASKNVKPREPASSLA